MSALRSTCLRGIEPMRPRPAALLTRPLPLWLLYCWMGGFLLGAGAA